jgi:hypothetical protein
MKKYQKLLAILTMFALVLCFGVSCTSESEPKETDQGVEEAVEEETEPAGEVEPVEEAEIVETEEETIEADVEEDKIAETRKKDYEIFRNEIEDYHITEKAYEYAGAVAEIMSDYVDTETETLKMTKEEVAKRYLDLSSEVGWDFLVIAMAKENILKDSGIKEITPDMLKAINLIDQWQEIKKREFEYTAKYYYGDGVEYDIKADELNDEATAIADEYLNLMNSMYLSINPE